MAFPYACRNESIDSHSLHDMHTLASILRHRPNQKSKRLIVTDCGMCRQVFCVNKDTVSWIAKSVYKKRMLATIPA